MVDTSKSDRQIDLSKSCRVYLENDQIRAVCPSEVLEQAVHAEPKRIVFELENEGMTQAAASALTKSDTKEQVQVENEKAKTTSQSTST